MVDFVPQIEEHIQNLRVLVKQNHTIKVIEKVASKMAESLKENKPVLIFGNGGSASDALHISGELVGRFLDERRALNVICLNSNVSVLTAWGNDYNFETIFSRQVEAHGKPDGVCFGISTSGNSKNVIEAMKVARSMKMTTIALSGNTGGYLPEMCDYLIKTPSVSTPRIQEMHLPIYHYICEKVEKNINS